MKKIITFGASNSKESINSTLATFVARQIEDIKYEVLDLNDFEMPIYSIDREKSSGIPTLATVFKEKIKEADGIVISFAEHNGIFSSAYKNIYDWVSRIDQNVWDNKPMFLLATSPGQRGGSSVLNFASTMYKYANTNTVISFSLPSFYENFDVNKGIKDDSLSTQFQQQLTLFTQALKTEKEVII
ncbi:NADPH-dependent FMN reductase [Flammeovirga kamogawensis]|uniref:NAD(P)H-dependent oxidoreductase n=1 Tax=Flammeovirga kamogawensis TaxID=373891 RepID=A0ABX8H1T6_9BACT|nr:NAD(P)H-dependent oxidoreductase [Flammeovirga kamogawensis]MBB6462218.1 NAD(P)H-dependent FMN reductase [Flammeovirga kamogawensis]QWG09381.1 NAD(P)H-dependent oxidoreductase [Flammeovirga kamogawensis]TRX64899.1 NAD(P)H-dependent oxidoreductase [Flammeovirga kamogawensis]